MGMIDEAIIDELSILIAKEVNLILLTSSSGDNQTFTVLSGSLDSSIGMAIIPE